jgi:hypothetical protein
MTDIAGGTAGTSQFARSEKWLARHDLSAQDAPGFEGADRLVETVRRRHGNAGFLHKPLRLDLARAQVRAFFSLF